MGNVGSFSGQWSYIKSETLKGEYQYMRIGLRRVRNFGRKKAQMQIAPASWQKFIEI